MVVGIVRRQVERGPGLDFYPPPVDSGANVAGLRIPLSDLAFGKLNVSADVHLAVRVKIDDRRFHANGPRQISFGLWVPQSRRRALHGVHELWQIGSAVQRPPLQRNAVLAGDRSEGAPLVNNQRILRRRFSRRRASQFDCHRRAGCNNDD